MAYEVGKGTIEQTFCQRTGVFKNAQGQDMLPGKTDGWPLTRNDDLGYTWKSTTCDLDTFLIAMCLHTGDWRAVAEQETASMSGLARAIAMRDSMKSQAIDWLSRNVKDEGMRGHIEGQLLDDIILHQLEIDGWVIVV